MFIKSFSKVFIVVHNDKFKMNDSIQWRKTIFYYDCKLAVEKKSIIVNAFQSLNFELKFLDTYKMKPQKT